MAGLFSGDRVAATSSAGIPADDIAKSGVRAPSHTVDQPDIDAFATKSAHEAAAMLWNYHDDDLPAAGAQVQVMVAGIPSGVKKVLLEHYRIDDTHSNSYTVWKSMGSPQTPTAEQYARLKEAGQLELLSSPEWTDVSDGKVTIATELPRQATSLLRLKW
jgi:xylan 1,4-beta-xylosidase